MAKRGRPPKPKKAEKKIEVEELATPAVDESDALLTEATAEVVVEEAIVSVKVEPPKKKPDLSRPAGAPDPKHVCAEGTNGTHRVYWLHRWAIGQYGGAKKIAVKI